VQNLLASEGNTDGDRDVDTVDLTGMIMNYTGQLWDRSLPFFRKFSA